jgi:excisionase family DNA binding protein
MEKLALSVQETAKLLGVSKSQLYKEITNNNFPHFCIGKRILISKESIYSYIKEKENCKEV